MVIEEFNIGDEVVIINEGNYYCDINRGNIPKNLIIHGCYVKHSSPNAKIVDKYENYYIVNYINKDNNIMQLGFKKENLRLVKKKDVVSSICIW